MTDRMAHTLPRQAMRGKLRVMAETGRPSKYKPTYCNLLIEHMQEGASIASFAAEIGVARSTINEWADAHPDFSEALKKGKAKCAAWWEKQLRGIATEGGGPGSATAVIFGLKNMASEDWREKQEVEHSGGVKFERVERTIVDPANPNR